MNDGGKVLGMPAFGMDGWLVGWKDGWLVGRKEGRKRENGK